MMKQFFIKIHRILGSFLSLVFLVWFLSGFVMMFSGFPHSDEQKTFDEAEILAPYKQSIEIPKNLTPQQLTLEVVNSIPVYTYDNKTVNAQNLENISMFSEKALDSMVMARCKAPFSHKEILNDYDSWIPWEHFNAYFPIHKYYIDDDAKTEVYVAGTTGKVVQESTSKTRWLARIGAIPHWFYFKSLRLNRGLWSDFLIWLSGFGCIMCLSGLVVGIYRSRKWKKAKKRGVLGFSPYKEKWYRWHHIVGMVFGVFTFTFVFSGMLSLQRIPQWIAPTDKIDYYTELWKEQATNFDLFRLPIQKILEDKDFSDVKKIQWRQIDSIPYYFVYKTYNEPIIIKANNPDTVLLKTFSYEELKALSAKKFNGNNYTIEQMLESDSYYKVKGNTIAKIRFDDDNNTWIYIDSKNPTLFRTINKNRRISRWLYKGLHTFNFPFLTKTTGLRITLLIIISIFGVIISLSGVILGYRYFRKKIRKMRK